MTTQAYSFEEAEEVRSRAPSPNDQAVMSVCLFLCVWHICRGGERPPQGTKPDARVAVPPHGRRSTSAKNNGLPDFIPSQTKKRPTD